MKTLMAFKALEGIEITGMQCSRELGKSALMVGTVGAEFSW